MKIKHPDHDLEREVSDQAAEKWLDAGWLAVETDQSEPEGDPDPDLGDEEPDLHTDADGV